MKHQPSVLQQNIIDWVTANLGTGHNACAEAVAGAAKTTTGIMIWETLPKELRSVSVAFAKHNADDLKQKLPLGSDVRTYNSLGRLSLVRRYPESLYTEGKTEKFVKKIVSPNLHWITPSVCKLVSLAKGKVMVAADCTDDVLQDMAFEYDVDLYDDKDDRPRHLIFSTVRQAMVNALESLENSHDFDDQIWGPLVDPSVTVRKYDFIFGDEFQDTNLAQMYLLMNSTSDTGVILGAGDRRQAIFGFRGAHEGAMDTLVNTLEAQTLPLSMSYRCPQVIREMVNQKFPDIQFTVPEWAKVGSVEHIQLDKAVDFIQPDDLIICRIKADLIPMAFRLIKAGIPATVRGRQIGKTLATLIKKMKASDLEELFIKLDNWKEKEIQKALRLNPGKVDEIVDRFDTILALSEGANSIDELLGLCVSMFDNDRAKVYLSTVHGAKGLEAERVFILRPDLLPHPKAKRPAQIRAEANLEYVAITRTKDKLFYIHGEN